MTRFEQIGEGHVDRRTPGHPAPVAAGSRCVVVRPGELACTYMVQSKLGINDFVPVLARSHDDGKSWAEPAPLWPGLTSKWSIFGSISRAPTGELFFFGARCPIDTPGESLWSDATKGLKQNELIWSVSTNGGHEWTNLAVIPMPIPGAAEAAGPMCVTHAGRRVACYSPYNTFDPAVKVDRPQVVAVHSADQGRTWRHASMLRFDAPESGGAEAWVVELADSRLLGTAWNVNLASGDHKAEYPNAYALSGDGGATWSPTRSTGIMGHTTALAPLPDGRALFLYVKRKPLNDAGLWLAVVRPTAEDFGVEANEAIWKAARSTQSDQDADHDRWTDFNFGEPCVTLMADKTLLVCYWYIDRDSSGVRWIRLRMND